MAKWGPGWGGTKEEWDDYQNLKKKVDYYEAYLKATLRLEKAEAELAKIKKGSVLLPNPSK